MLIRKLRLKRGWSQEQLAEMTGLSTRTIQRIERGQAPGLESQKALAAVFELDLAELQLALGLETDTSEDDTMHSIEAQPPTPEPRKPNAEKPLADDEREALEYVRDIKAFYSNLATYVCVIGFLAFINIMTSPGHLWFLWPAFGWGIGIAIHALNVFEITNFFGQDWEKRQVEKRLGRKL